MSSPRFTRRFLFLLAAFALLSATPVRADVIELVNGDRYQGTVISMTQGEVEFQSEVQGRLKLPRAKISRIILNETTPAKPAVKSVAPTNSAFSTSVSATNAAVAPATADALVRQMQQTGVDSNIVSQVQQQVIGGGNPEAAAKFNELMGGLMTGSLSTQDIRTEAQTSIAQIKEAKQVLGDDAGDLLDGYLAILEKFVQQTAPAPVIKPASQPAITNTAATPAVKK